MFPLVGLPLFIALITCVAFSLFKRKFIVALLFGLLTFFVNLHFKLFSVNFKENVSSELVIKVMTYNVNGWGNWQTGWRDKQDLLEWVRSQDVDILSIQELMYWEAPDLWKSLCGFYQYNNCSDVLGSNVEPLTFSKYPISRSERINEHINSVEIVVEDDTINVISCYMPSNNISKAKTVTDYYHLIDNGYSERKKQVDLLSRFIKNKNTIILGDLNDVSGSYSLRFFESLGFKDAWWYGGNGLGLTFCNFPFYYRLDHISYSERLEIKNVSVPHVYFSDHYPVIAELIIND